MLNKNQKQKPKNKEKEKVAINKKIHTLIFKYVFLETLTKSDILVIPKFPD